MALTLRILTPDGGSPPELTLGLDAPRVVIGRSRSCEVMLPDATVSARHATIEQRGGRNLITDEGSTNGVLVGTDKLAPRSPHPLGDREIVRVGRVWLEVRTGLGAAGAAGQAEALAWRWLAARLEADGEVAHACVEAVEGPHAGERLELADPDREYVCGRSQQTDWSLAADGKLSRRHLSVAHRAGHWTVRDLGSKRGSELDGEPLSTEAARWRDGARVTLGDTVLVLHDPLAEAMAEALAAPDLRMRSSEFAEPAPGTAARDPGPAAEAEAAASGGGDGGSSAPPAPAGDEPWDGAEADPEGYDDDELDEREAPSGSSAHLVEMVVVLVALAVLGLSVAGLMWVLGS